MGVGAGLYICDVVKKFTFAISSPDEFLLSTCSGRKPLRLNGTDFFVGQISFLSSSSVKALKETRH